MLALQGDGGTLTIEVVNENGWCRCHIESGLRTFLGADVIERIASRLLEEALGEDDVLGPVSGQLAGYGVRCALLLSEAHHALYVATEGCVRVLIWQNANMSPMPVVGIIKLSPEQRHRWVSEIKKAFPGF